MLTAFAHYQRTAVPDRARAGSRGVIPFWLEVTGMLLVATFVVAVFVLRFVGTATASLRVDGWGAALAGAVGVIVLDSAVSWVLPGGWHLGPWLTIGANWVVQALIVVLAGLMLPGIAVRGVLGPATAGGLLTAANYFLPQAVMRLPF
jgi:hypothetical protein